MTRIGIVLVALFICNSVLAKEYHVSKSGNDSNAGTKASPFLTIQAAANIGMPGGTSTDKRIIYQAVKGEKVVIKGSEIIKGWKKVINDTWTVVLSNSFFGEFNPFADVISGDWFRNNGRVHHTGAVYLNGSWLSEAAAKNEVLGPAGDNPLWFAHVDNTNTTIWAQFKDVDPGSELVEVNARQSVFYPEKPGMNYITVRGFIMEQAATPWAPPTAEQIGLLGTHWSRGWVIEDNTIRYSVCTGITLGKYGDEFDNKAGTLEGYFGTIKRALANGWNKENVGSHIVRNNHIHDCEQGGIIGSMGAGFSIISGNEIHDIHVRRLFSGMEMAGIKIHGSIDMVISHNHIYRCWRGIWLDWMAQGTRITGNILHDNETANDLFFEVDHGPLLIDNNLFLSANSLRDISQGVAYAHNLFAGRIITEPDERLTPYFRIHSTEIAGNEKIVCGDDRYYNNIFSSFNGPAPWPERQGSLREGNFFGLAQYDSVGMPMYLGGNVFLSNAKPCIKEQNPIVDPTFNPGIRLEEKPDGWWMEMSINPAWDSIQKRAFVNTGLLGKAKISDMPFEMTDGSSITIDKDFFNEKRSNKNPMAGPFEHLKPGINKFKVW
jgi:alpha-N-arabinofuranosidase